MPQDKILASLDIGTNTVLMLIAKCGPDGVVVPMNEYVATTRLGEGTSTSGALAVESVERTIEAAAEMKRLADGEGVEHLIVTATSAVRDAPNRSEFLVKFHQRLKIYPQVLSGREEARLMFIGGTSKLPGSSSVVIFDLGGGSCEIAYGRGDDMVAAHSIPAGFIKLAETFDLKKKMTLTRLIGAQNQIRKLALPLKYEILEWADENNPRLLLCGGTATCYAAILKRQRVYDREMINMTPSDRKTLVMQMRRIAKTNLNDRMKIPGMEKERAEYFPSGLLVFSTLMGVFNFDEFKITADGLRLGTLRYYVDERLRGLRR